MSPIRTTLTYDTDEGRKNSSPCLVILSTGQKIAFYSKYLTTGKESFSRITFTSPSFIVNVEAGEGTLNGVHVTWDAATLEASKNSRGIVFVDSSNHVDIGSNLSMSFLADKIILAYVSSGDSSITRISEFEHTGDYIYVRRQTLIGANWVWNDYEELLNTGSEPSCFYNSVQDRIYVNYKKDSASYVRSFNPNDELTWEYLSNISISDVSNTITLNRNPENTFSTTGTSSGYITYAKVRSTLFYIGIAGFAYDLNNVYVFLPYLTGDFNSYIIGAVTYDFFYKVGDTYTLERSYTIDPYITIDFYKRCRIWTGTPGVKYIGIRVYTKLFLSEYVTDPEDYSSFEIFTPPIKVALEDNNYNVNAKSEIYNSSISSGFISSYVKTSEFIESRAFGEEDYFGSAVSSGFISSYVKTSEFIESRAFGEEDYFGSAVSSGYLTYFIINNS